MFEESAVMTTHYAVLFSDVMHYGIFKWPAYFGIFSEQRISVKNPKLHILNLVLHVTRIKKFKGMASNISMATEGQSNQELAWKTDLIYGLWAHLANNMADSETSQDIWYSTNSPAILCDV